MLLKIPQDPFYTGFSGKKDGGLISARFFVIDFD